MQTKKFNADRIKSLYKAPFNSSKMDNGQITIIGGSKLFHGAPILALKAASRVVDMVYFASPEPSVGEVAAQIKSKLSSFIWVDWDDLGKYIKKSDAVLIGSGLMRASREKDDARIIINKHDEEYLESRELTRDLLVKYPNKRWVIDAGSLQVMEPEWIPPGAVLTPNKKEYEMLFGDRTPAEVVRKFKCVLVIKGPVSIVYSEDVVVEVEGGNPGLTKGGTGDVEAGLTCALMAKNDPLISAAAASFIVKKSAEALAENRGNYYNSDDLSEKIFEVLNEYSK